MDRQNRQVQLLAPFFDYSLSSAVVSRDGELHCVDIEEELELAKID